MTQGSYSSDPADKEAFTERFDRLYSRTAGAYDLAVRRLPVWRRWLASTLPEIEGPRVLEVSCGTGWLLAQCARRFEMYGLDLNPAMLARARRNLERSGVRAELRGGNVEALPYRDEMFDTVVNTMSFSGYPDAEKAMSELRRVLKPEGRLVMVDVNFPRDGNRLGTVFVELWKRTGDLVRDVNGLLEGFGFEATDREIGGFGSIHLYVARKG